MSEDDVFIVNMKENPKISLNEDMARKQKFLVDIHTIKACSTK